MLAIVIAIGTVFAVILFLQARQRKYTDFILKNSLCLKQLTEINNRYTFYSGINLNQKHTYDNEDFFNDISCQDYLIYQLQFIKKDVIDQIEKIKINERLYDKYLEEIATIKQSGQFQIEPGKLKIEKLLKLENKLIEEQIYHPILRFILTVTLYCSKINGQIYSSKSEDFYDNDVLSLIARLNKKRGSYFTDREIWNALCRVERGKVSNKMRFSIYARDGYRCCRCGASGRFVKLEIDHIIPIAKGGKSTYDNLQTLCHNCNVEKGDKY